MKRIFLAAIFFPLLSFSQTTDKDPLVQFSGVAVTADSLKPVPFTSIMIKNSNRGTVSDFYGFFSFVAKMRDTIEFVAIGYKRAQFIIPDTLKDQRISMIQVLHSDTVMLRPVDIFPWPTLEEFKQAFINHPVPDDDLSRAEKNLNPEELAYIAAAMTMDGNMNFRNYMSEQQTRLYYNNQIPQQSIFDPIKWATFIKQWQSGAFKKKKEKK
jgi:hypothetical protein